MNSHYDGQKLKQDVERVLLALVVAGGMVAGYYWGYDQPARQYRHNEVLLTEATKKLMDSAKVVADIDTSLYFNDSSVAVDSRHSNSARVVDVIRQHTDLLLNLESVAARNPPAYLFGLTREYTRAQAHKVRAATVVKQSRQVLEDYRALVDYLGVYSDVSGEYIAITERFGATTDLNMYAGRSGELRSDAASINALADRLGSAQPPDELSAFRNVAVTVLRETAAGFSDFADAIDTTIENEMDAAAQRIDTATGRFYAEISDTHPTVVEDSNILKEIGELPDKYTIESFE